MPDITKCKGNDCPMKEQCHRFTCMPGKYQGYFVESPFKFDKTEPKCEYFWETTNHL